MTVYIVFSTFFSSLVQQSTNETLAQVIVLPNPGSAQYDSIIQKVMNCHVCLGKSSACALIMTLQLRIIVFIFCH